MEDTKRAIAVKFSSSGTAFDYNFDPAQLTVRQLKEKLASHTTIPADSMRLVYSGRVLKDEDVVETYGVKEGHTIHVVRGAVNRATEQAANMPPGSSRPTAASSNPFGMNSFGLGAVDPELVRSLMNSPMLRHFLSNPDFIRSMVMQNPTMRQMIERNPEIGHIINDPSFIRQTMDMARNPELMREMMRNNDRALANLETIPGGFNHLRRMYHTLQEPLESAGRQNDQSSEAANQRLAQLLNVERPPEGRINTLPLPNPWAPPRNNAANSTQSAANQFPAGLPFGFLGFPGQLPFAAPSSISRTSQNSSSSANSSTTTTSAPQTNASSSTPSSANTSNSGFTGFGYPFPTQNLHDPEFVRRMQQAVQRVMSSSGYGTPRQQLLFPPSLFGPPPSFLANVSPSSSSPSSLGAPQQSAAQTTAPSTEPPETRFSTQLQSLEEMGFADQAHNIRALLATEGDLVRAVEWLLQNPNS